MFQDIIDALIDIVLWVPRWLFSLIVDVLEMVIAWIPEIDMLDPSTVSSGMTSDMLYFTSLMEVPYGLTAIGTALFARFVVRRIPVIG